MKKLLFAALAAFACAALPATSAIAQQAVGYQDTVGGRVVVKPATPSQGLPVNCVSGCAGSEGAATAAKQDEQSAVLEAIQAAAESTEPVAVSLPAGPTADLTAINTKSGETHGTLGSAAPAKAGLAGALSGANIVGLVQASASVPIDMSTATTTQLVALTSGQRILVTAWDAMAAGTTTFKLVYGTGTNCGTGTTNLTAAYDWTAQAGLTKGSGLGPVLVVPAGNALCGVNSAAVHVAGSVAYDKQP